MSSRRIRRSPGFTLIELLVTLVIIGIVVSIATLSLGNNEAQQVEETADRLSALIMLAKEEALFNAQEMGIAFSQGGYAFYRLENQRQEDRRLENQQQWVPVTDDSDFKPRVLPPGLSIALSLEGIEADLPPRLEQRKRPQVFIMSSGEMTPFKASIGVGDTYVTLTADALGNLSYARPAS